MHPFSAPGAVAVLTLAIAIPGCYMLAADMIALREAEKGEAAP